jgi:hypothetical protein
VAEDGGEIFLMVVWGSLSAVARVAVAYEQRENAWVVLIYEDRSTGVLRFAEDDEREWW